MAGGLSTHKEKGTFMNILLFLTPKQEVTFLYEDYTIAQALRVMERVRYNAVPIIRRTGQYVGSITEGDLLWRIRSLENGFADVETAPLKDVPHRKDYRPLQANMSVRDLLETSMDQNFAPVVDDRGMFIGIITRKRVISYLRQRLERKAEEAARPERRRA